MARRRKAHLRDITGILLLDKPVGMSSNGVLQIVKRLYKAQKAGHTGSLDPLASGMLPICLGEATKVSQYLLDAHKCYETRIKLGVITDSGDADGNVIETRPVETLSQVLLDQMLDQFRGPISQIPPMYSALKRDGQPLYKLARQGITVERKPRDVEIKSLKILAYTGDTLSLSVRCSKGTYIRTLAEDIGQMLGCGGHVEVLRRTSVTPFDEMKMITLADLEALVEPDASPDTHSDTNLDTRSDTSPGIGIDVNLDVIDALLLAPDQALPQWENVHLAEDSATLIKQGQAVLIADAPDAGLVKLYQNDGVFFGMGHILEDGRVAPKRLMNVG